MYTKQVIERFENPKNVGILDGYNAKGKCGDPDCSDVVEIYFKFKEDVVIDAKFKVFGCPGAISTTDIFIDMIKGKKIDDCMKITEIDISNALGGLPVEHMHCSHISMDAFRKAVKKYKDNV